MEWVGLMIWALAAGLGLALAGAGGLTSPSLGIAGLLAGAGFVFAILFPIIDGPRWPAWVSAGLALAGALFVALGCVRLLSDEPRAGSAGQAAEEQAAALAGVELPLLATVAFCMILAAAGITTVG
jgi:hypothetical protein